MDVRRMTRLAAWWACVALVAAAPVFAEEVTVTHGSTSVTLEMVDVGDAGNAADANSFTGDYGDVDYDYKIGKYEISVDQWDTVIGAAPLAGHTWSGNQPVANVRLFEAAKFANWLTSGDPTMGVYTLGGLPTVTAIDREGALDTYGTIFVLPTNDEWHKAAFYVSSTGTYQKHPTGAARPTAVTGGTGQDTAVYLYAGEASPTAPADIDNAGGLSPYGTMGQPGNVQEYVEGLVVSTGPYFRGGAYSGSDYMFRNTTTQFGPGSTWNANAATGFRVVMLSEAEVILGDVNGDGVVDGLDIQPFVDLLTGGGYQAEADINTDEVVDGLDIQPFVDIITGAGGNPVPEPATLGLLAVGGLAALARRRRN